MSYSTGRLTTGKKKPGSRHRAFFHYDRDRRYLSSIIFMVFVYPPDFTV